MFIKKKNNRYYIVKDAFNGKLAPISYAKVQIAIQNGVPVAIQEFN